MRRIEIDYDEKGICLDCYRRFHATELEWMPKRDDLPADRCIVCGQPTGPLRPLDDEIVRRL